MMNMSRVGKCIIFLLVLLMGGCSLFYTLSLHISVLNPLHGFMDMLSILTCAVAIITMIILFLVSFLHKGLNPIINHSQHKILQGVTLGLFLLYTVSFMIKSGIAGWERGSEVYMNAMIPVILPLLAGIVESMAHMEYRMEEIKR